MPGGRQHDLSSEHGSPANPPHVGAKSTSNNEKEASCYVGNQNSIHHYRMTMTCGKRADTWSQRHMAGTLEAYHKQSTQFTLDGRRCFMYKSDDVVFIGVVVLVVVLEVASGTASVAIGSKAAKNARQNISELKT